jgi:hypothetical protein
MCAHNFVPISALLTRSVEESNDTRVTPTDVVPSIADTRGTSFTAPIEMSTLTNHGADIFARAHDDAGISPIPFKLDSLQVFQDIKALTDLTCVSYDQTMYATSNGKYYTSLDFTENVDTLDITYSGSPDFYEVHPYGIICNLPFLLILRITIVNALSSRKH